MKVVINGRRVAVLILTMALAACTACSSLGDARSETARSSADSAYALQLKEYLRDSTVLDSLTRLVRTDSLYRLYRQALEPNKVDVKLVAAIWCEEARLTIRYRPILSDRAINRLRDTVYRDFGIEDAFRYVASRAPSEGQFNSSICGEFPDKGPTIVNGTSLEVEPRRPTRPRRWFWTSH